MIIQSGNVEMNSARKYESRQASFTTAKLWGSAQGKLDEVNNGQLEKEGEEPKTKSGSNFDNLMERYKATQNLKQVSLQERLDNVSRIRRQTLDYLLYVLFGRRIDDNSYVGNETSSDDTSTDTIEENTNSFLQATSVNGSMFQWNYFCEQETTSFQTTGTVVTSDGRTMEFNVELEMTRRFMELSSSQVDFGATSFKDPLVINLDCASADVRDQKFLFDIDADGNLDEISMLGEGSGYLALDLNEDGEINDGSELFGTRSGNGFADLAKYDSDGNGWIDEADEIFDKLKVWCMDESGKGRLIDLKSAGVGAMYLGSSSTEFSLNDAYNQTNAAIRRTGFFLYENGGTGTIQQLDLAT